MRRTVKISNTTVGDGEPCYIVGEIGINHNGAIEIAKKRIDVAAEVHRGGGRGKPGHGSVKGIAEAQGLRARR